FFFQAEDGIRDFHVTGVQTCALPIFNLCEDRYRFLVAFCAVAVRGQANLLPPSRTRAAIDEVRAQYPDSYCIGDGDACGCDALQIGRASCSERVNDAVVASARKKRTR